MQLNSIELLKQGIYADALTPTHKLFTLAKKLSPVVTNFPLIRIGGNNDGGYLLPNDLDGILACFSPGVADNASFEIDLLNKTGIYSHLADFSVDGPPNGFTPKSFTKKFIASYNSETTITIDDWVNKYESNSNDLICQMDIEGSEYSSLLSASEHSLLRFRIIALELHNTFAWGQQQFFDIADQFISKLLSYFHVVHIHPNNNDGILQLGNFPAPRTLEITFLRKDRSPSLGFVTDFPHVLDKQNELSKDDVILPSAWYTEKNFSININKEKTMLVRPLGGINDQLCAIGKCVDYAIKYNRKLYIDTTKSGLHDNFFRYFTPINFNAQHPTDSDYKDFDLLECLPSQLNGRVSKLEVYYSKSKGGFCDIITDELTSFDFLNNHTEDQLIYQQGWLGLELHSFELLKRLKLTSESKSSISKKLDSLPSNYCAVHIRHTDYTTDYENFLSEIAPLVMGQTVLICTDNSITLDRAKQMLSQSNVINLLEYHNNGNPLHLTNFGVLQYNVNIDALTDLFALALSSNLFITNVQNASRPSGFSLLAKALNYNKNIVKALFD